MEYTQEEKKAYFKGLRFRWEEAKKIADHDAIGAIIKSHGLNISITSFFIVHSQMQAQGLEGLPYLDMKTFKGWKENGFQVKKGEHAKAESITWIGVHGKEVQEGTPEKENGYVIPKVYKLFHRSQVEEIQYHKEAQ
jgi:hypothetical protein